MSSHWVTRSRSALWFSAFIALVGLLSAVVRAQQGSGDDGDDTRERLILLANGRMMTGQVTRIAGGYIIEQSNGRVQVAADDVKFIVKDLQEAYRKQRDSIVEPTPATHIALAQWCISYRLHDEARDELKKCLAADPSNVEGRRLLQRLTDTIRDSLPPTSTNHPLLKTAEGFVQPLVESLGGLQPETAAQFTSRIQPLLLNKCGNAACHGFSSTNTFRLLPARIGGTASRKNTDHNLAEVLRYLDLEDLDGSQLMRVTRGPHGGKGAAFVGPGSAEQTKAFRAWVRTVWHEKQEEAQERKKLPSVVKKKNGSKTGVNHAISAKVKDVESTIRKSSFDSETDEEMHPPAKPRELKADPTDAAALAMQPDDLFDPEKFNRRP